MTIFQIALILGDIMIYTLVPYSSNRENIYVDYK